MSSKTKALIFDKYLELIQTTDYNKISVTDIVEKCAISRQTFYYHFDDIDEMIIWDFDDAAKKINAASLNGSGTDFLHAFVPFLQKHEGLIRNAIRSSDFLFMYNRLTKLFYDTTYFYVTEALKLPKTLPENTALLLEYCVYSSVGLIVKFAQQNDKAIDSEVTLPLALVVNIPRA